MMLHTSKVQSSSVVKGLFLSDKNLNANKLNFHHKNAIAKKNALSTQLLRSGISA